MKSSVCSNCVAQLRRGVTLIEVLMSLMIMGIGVSLVVALFPISAIRTAQATKMTNAAVLKYNVESVLDRQPNLIFDPNGDWIYGAGLIADLREHVSAPTEQNYIVDPNGYLSMAAVAEFMNDVSGPPVDRKFCDYFGNTGPTTALETLPRFDGGLRAQYSSTVAISYPAPDATNLRALSQVASIWTRLGDGWSTEYDDIAAGLIPGNGGGTVAGVLLSEDANVVDFPTSDTDMPRGPGNLVHDQELSRITVFSQNGDFSQSYVLTAVRGTGANTGRECLWSEDLNLDGVFDASTEDFNQNGVLDERDLPAEFLGGVGRVLIQRRRSHDFNWMLTVRRGGDGSAFGVDVVVTYNNGVTPSDERVFTTAAGNGFNRGDFTIQIPSTSGVDEDGEDVEPHLRRGGYVLDVDNAHWYRIRDYADVPNTSPLEIEVTLETAANESSPAAGGNAIFLPGVVDVFPLGSVEYPSDYPALSAF